MNAPPVPTPMTPATPPLRLAILGAGKIGSTFAFQLARTGRHDVTVIARPGSARLAQLQRDGAIVDVKGEQAAVRVMKRLDEAVRYDLVIVTLLTHQVDAVLPALGRCAADCIQFMFNTFEADKLAAAVGAGRGAFGMPFVQALLTPDGRLDARIGVAGQTTRLSQQRWVDVFNEAGLPAVLEPDMPLWLRCHTPLCVAFESVSVAGVRRGGGASWGEALRLARGIHACFALIESQGFVVYPRGKQRMNQCPAWGLALMLWAMSRIRSFRELLATGEAECIALVEIMVAAAERTQPPARIAAIQAMKPSRLSYAAYS